MKINTALQYDENYEEVIAWGAMALDSEPNRSNRSNRRERKNNKRPLPKPVELFKLHLGKVPESKRPILPPKVPYKRAITDYLREMGNNNHHFLFNHNLYY